MKRLPSLKMLFENEFSLTRRDPVALKRKAQSLREPEVLGYKTAKMVKSLPSKPGGEKKLYKLNPPISPATDSINMDYEFPEDVKWEYVIVSKVTSPDSEIMMFPADQTGKNVSSMDLDKDIDDVSHEQFLMRHNYRII